MTVTQTILSVAETISLMKTGGQSDNAIDRKEEAQAILKFAKLKVDMFLKSKDYNADELKMILDAANEADKYMISGASDISEEELNAYNTEKEKGILGNISNLVKAFADFNKNMNVLKDKSNKNNALNARRIQNIENSLNSIKKVQMSIQFNP